MTKQRILALEALQHIGETITLQGWVNNKRDHGKLTFIDLRDRSGEIQCVGFGMLSELSNETVVEITGTVQARPERLVNPEMATGTIELSATEYVILNKAHELPIQVNDDGLTEDENVRLRYRYLDLRRQRMQKILRLRSDYNAALREALLSRKFVEVETPMLTKSTKEGARDFIVPSRFQPGKFYALPQSPQQYKQLLMTAGVERYFQFARCIRDEDLRADRGFEFTQLDIEMSFVDSQQARDVFEAITIEAVEKVGGKIKQKPFPVYEYQDAIAQFGADKFDLRTDEDKANGVLAFAWVINFPFFKKVDTGDVAEVRDGKSGWTFTHNPFSAPLPEYLEDHLAKRNLENILTSQYDLVCNGYEAGGGSIRAHQPEVLRTTFEIMGYSHEEIEESVGHMLEAFRMGTPPHGGIAFGLDRHIMNLTGEKSIKDTIAFPMTSTGRTAVMDAPAEVSPEQLRDLHIQVVPEEK
jgi:aspartyl-tRNA synthetase